MTKSKKIGIFAALTVVVTAIVVTKALKDMSKGLNRVFDYDFPIGI